MSGQYLTVPQVAAQLQLDVRTIRKAIRLGHLEAALIFGQWRISPEALEAYIGACTPIVQIKRKRKTA